MKTSYFQVALISLSLLIIGCSRTEEPDIAEILLNPDCLLVDARSGAEFYHGHLEGAVSVPFDEIESRITQMEPDKERLILVYSRGGRRSRIATETLTGLGYINAIDGGAMEPLSQIQRELLQQPASP